MRGCAEAEESDAVAWLNAGYSQAAKANDARAEKWRGVQVVQFRRKLEHKIAARRGILRVTAVDGISGECRRIAKIFEATAAVWAISVDAADPGNAYARAKRQLGRCAFYDVAHDLMAGDESILARRQFALNDVQIRAAHAARPNSKQHLTRCRLRLGSVFDLKRLFRGFENGGFHRL